MPRIHRAHPSPPRPASRPEPAAAAPPRPELRPSKVPARNAVRAEAHKADSPFVRLIDGAQQELSVHVWTTDPRVLDRLIAARQRGVEVRVLLSFPGPMTEAVREAQERLEAAGVDVKVSNKRALPTEAVLVDGRAYADPRSAHENTDPHQVASEAAAFERAFGKAPVGGEIKPLGPSRVRMWPMPESTSAPIVAAIDRARSSIDLEVYQLSDSGVNAALKRAAARGVKVRVMLEPQVVAGGNYAVEAKLLQKAGVEVKPTPPAFDAHHNVDHAKFLVLDQKELLFGTGNLVRSGLGGNDKAEANNRDFWVEDTRVRSATEAATLFADDWDRKSTAGVEFKNLVLTPDNSDARLLALIDGAQQRLLVYNQELHDPAVVQHLLEAKQRGVEVQVLLGVQPGGPGGRPKNDPALQQLRQAGISAAYFTRNYLHAKGIIADDRAFLGSQNFSAGGLQKNRELGEILTDKHLVAKLAEVFAADAKSPGPQP